MHDSLSSAPTSDALLVQQVLDGNDAAFRLLLGRHLQPLRSYLALRAPVAHLIDEVAHDAFVFAYQNLEDFKTGSLQPWVRSIAHNLLRDRLKAHVRESLKQERYLDHQKMELALQNIEAPADDDRADRLYHCLEKLPPGLRAMLDLRYEQELTSDEIAARTGRSAVAVRTLLMRVRQQLRDCIESQPALS